MSRGAGARRILLRAAGFAAVLAGLIGTQALAAPSTTETRDLTVDTDPPTVTLNAGPTGPTNDPTPSFGWTATDDNPSFRQCSLDQGTPAFGPCTTATTYDAPAPLPEGSYTFRIRVRGTASNTATDTRDFTVDLTPPTVTLNAGSAGPTNDPRPTFGWTTAAENDRDCSIDQGTPAFAACTSLNQETPQTDLADGAYVFRVRVTDPAGNTATATRNFSVDTHGPAATLAGPRRTGERKPTFEVSSPEPGATFSCRLDGKPPVPCGPTFKPRRKLKPGRHRLAITAFDALGNPGPPDTLRFKILRPPLSEHRAQATVATALRRHKFADEVVENLKTSCSRRSRFKFECRFSSAFTGYRLEGRGLVQRRKQLSYRFRVQAQGQTIMLTDENEGRFPA